ncbi:MAG: hypothetical protein NTX96_03225 [Candidatus Zambryskibacteria bacterium]|nr:hypothetical protein [Candidatus Zambryskibacteria bacterium]
MNQTHPNKVGLTFGAFLGGAHLLWAILVLLGWAQPLFDFIFKIHMIEPPFIVAPFDVTLATMLVVVTTVIGYIFGYVFALVWNKFHK